MPFWTNVVIIAHVIVALSIIGLVLLQHGKGADMGSGFGGGASGSLFGATGSANFLSRATAALAKTCQMFALNAIFGSGLSIPTNASCVAGRCSNSVAIF